MRKFIHGGAVKYTDNDVKARQLLEIGYKEVKADGKEPKFQVQQAQPADPDVDTKEVDKGAHTTEEPTTDKVEDDAAGDADKEPEKEPAKSKTASKTKK